MSDLDESPEPAETRLPAAYHEPDNKLTYVSGDAAMEFLSKAGHNRPLNRARSEELARAFRRGDHRVTGDAVVFDEADEMTNGQHRMLAVVIANLRAEEPSPSGKPFTELYPAYPVINGYVALPFWVMRGAAEDEQLVQDVGRSRTFIDQLKIQHVSNANMINGCTKLLWHYKRGTMSDVKAWNGRLSPSVLDLWRFYSKNDKLITSGVRAADRVRKVVPVNNAVLAVSWIAFTEIDPEDAGGFWDELSYKTEAGSPVRALQSVIVKNRKRSRGIRESGWYSSFDARTQMALVFKAWNAYRQGKDITGNLYFRSGGKVPEQFPKPV